MSTIISYLFIGVGLSIDAFFACLAVGCDKSQNKKAAYLAPFIIGFFHIAFPICFYLLTKFILQLPESSKIAIFSSYLAGGIFILLGIINVFKKEDDVKNFIVSFISILLLALSVSVDSILIGISFGFSKASYIYIGALIFGLISGLVAYYAIQLARCTIKGLKKANLYTGLFFILLGILSILQII